MALQLYTLCLTKVGSSLLHPVLSGSGSTGIILENFECLPNLHPRDGPWWLSWGSCRVPDLDVSQGHARWQPRILSNVSRDPTSLGLEIRSIVGEDHWADLCLLVPTSGQVKIPTTQLAFKAGPGVRTLPDNLGNGSSLSHLCDRSGCVSCEHLTLELAHANNLRRQRCPGVTLVTTSLADGFPTIVHESPCAHATGHSHLELLATSCRKIHIVMMARGAIEAINREIQVFAAAATAPWSSDPALG